MASILSLDFFQYGQFSSVAANTGLGELSKQDGLLICFELITYIFEDHLLIVAKFTNKEYGPLVAHQLAASQLYVTMEENHRRLFAFVFFELVSVQVYLALKKKKK